MTNAEWALADAILTSITLVLALAGFAAIRRREVRRHRRLMLSALASSAAFLAAFTYRYVCFGKTELHASGDAHRIAYAVVWYSHEPLAVVSVPLVVCAGVLGLRGAVDVHREVARIAFPIWLASAVTGLALYVILYGWPTSN